MRAQLKSAAQALHERYMLGDPIGQGCLTGFRISTYLLETAAPRKVQRQRGALHLHSYITTRNIVKVTAHIRLDGRRRPCPDPVSQVCRL